MKNYNTDEALKRLDPVLKTLPLEERGQLYGLVRDYGYLGAIAYLDPSVKHAPIVHRDSLMVESHYSILKQL